MKVVHVLVVFILVYGNGSVGVDVCSTGDDCKVTEDGGKVTGDGCKVTGSDCKILESNALCDYKVVPLTKTFGARIEGLDLRFINDDCANKLKEDSFMYRFLIFKNQSLPWQEQIKVTSLFGVPFEETAAVNRLFHERVPDSRLGFFSNDPKLGLKYQGTEGWHVDGQTRHVPHLFTMIYCVQANSNGPTLIVPLKEIVDMFSQKEREYLETILFVSGHNSSAQHPLLYKHPYRNDDTILLSLGSLSGQYLQNIDGSNTPKQLSKEETQYIMDLLLGKILASNLIYAVHYDPGDVLLLQNPSIAHFAGPGSQSPPELSGIREIHRTSVRGGEPPSKSTNLIYECHEFPPFVDGYCLFSLKNSVYYPRVGYFEDQSTSRMRCKNINKNADLAVIYTEEWNDVASRIISKTEVPHWLNATNPHGKDVFWSDVKGDYINWDPVSKQPNDHDGFEGCVVIGPSGKWFDLPCSGPKTKEGTDRAPVMIWEDSQRHMRNVYPMCGVGKQYIK